MKKMNGTQLLTRMALGAAFFLMSVVTAHSAEYVSVAKDGVNLRSGPDTKYSVLYELPNGYPLKVLSKKGQWLKVSDFENDQGWVFSPLVSRNSYVIVTVREGNVRSGAGINHDKVGEVVREVLLKKVGKQGDWVQVEHPKLKGWIHRKLIWP
jgi:SH3-like domain-containing protein